MVSDTVLHGQRNSQGNRIDEEHSSPAHPWATSTPGRDNLRSWRTNSEDTSATKPFDAPDGSNISLQTGDVETQYLPAAHLWGTPPGCKVDSRVSEVSTDHCSEDVDIFEGCSQISDSCSTGLGATTSALSTISSKDITREALPHLRQLPAQDVGAIRHDPNLDLRLATGLAELMGVKVGMSLAHALGERFCARPREVDRALRLLLGCFRFLQLCGYPREDIEVIAAFAATYGGRAGPRWGSYHEQPEMGIMETVRVSCVYIYLAHAYCEDRTCPLHVWHQHLFQGYCNMSQMNDFVVKILNKLEFRLRVQGSELEEKLAFFRVGDQRKMCSTAEETPCCIFQAALRSLCACFHAAAWPSRSRATDGLASCFPIRRSRSRASLSLALRTFSDKKRV